MASKKLVTGPARATHIMSRAGSRRLRTLTGTGLAQPKMKPVPRLVSRNTAAPRASKCETGLRVRRPMKRAVWSPLREAIQPWATSCMMMPSRVGIR